MAEIKLPRFDENYDESSVIFWHKQEGDSVQKGEIIVEVQTEKAVSEIEADINGVLEEIVVKRGEVAKVGDVLGIISDQATDSSIETNEETEKPVSANDSQEKTFVRIAPRLRRLAKELNVNLNEIKGTGRNGNITEKDIKQHAVSTTKSEELTGIRKTIANKMKMSLQNSAQLTETAYADVTRLASYRESYNVKLSWNSWIVCALNHALQEHNYMNGAFENEKWHESKAIHIGIATDTEQGLLVPVVQNAEKLSVKELDREISQKAGQARDKKIAQSDLTGSTFTITNLGSYGIHFFTPIINPPEVAILGVGKIDTYAGFEDGKVKQKYRLPLSLTFDHQLIDGAPAAKFLQTLISYLEQPEKMNQ